MEHIFAFLAIIFICLGYYDLSKTLNREGDIYRPIILFIIGAVFLVLMNYFYESYT